ncbi:MAG: Glu-tRNA(Gln) amidotransferase subunit GatE [Candidatus Anstonellales archaeon]
MENENKIIGNKVKIGIEIHQRLDVGKLFCQCKSKQESNLDLNFIVRELRPITSETGEIDIAALMQADKGNVFSYFGNNAACLVEYDEEPPHLVNEMALLCAINVAMQMNMKLPDAIIFMRKIIIDGSNTTGFQRTALIGIDGEINMQTYSIGIQTLSLEEESAGIISNNVYRLDRLGIPLLEISTRPDIKDGKQAREVAETIGLMLRTIPYTARGIGTIRQDLNVSIENGARVELKGAQELYMIDKWINHEIKRQSDLLKVIEELKRRGIDNEKVKKQALVDITDLFLSHEKELAGFIRNALANNEKVFAIKLMKHKGILAMQAGNRRYGSELADYAKAAGIGGIIHNDEMLDKYGINEALKREIKKALNMSEDDIFVIMVGKEEKINRASIFLKNRASMLFIPEETRKVQEDGSSIFMRPLPGKARMYPETDVPYIFLNDELKSKAKSIAQPFHEKIKKLEKMLNKEMAYKILKGRHLYLFEDLSKSIDPLIVAITLEDTITKIRREHGIEPKEHSIRRALELYKNGKITKKAIETAIIMLEKGKDEDEIMKSIGKISGKDLKALFDKIKDKKQIIKSYGIRVDYEELESIY